MSAPPSSNDALTIAVENGHAMARNTSTKMVERGTIKLAFYYTQTLMRRAAAGHLAGVQWFWRPDYCPSGAMDAALFYGHLNVVEFMLKTGQFEHTLQSRLIQACRYGHVSLVKCLLQHGADIHAHEDQVLRIACSGGNLDVVQFLLSCGAKVSSPAARVAARQGDLEMLKLLDQHGANFDADALEWAAANGHDSVVQWLLDRGARVSVRSLCLASERGRLEVVRLLCSSGLDAATISRAFLSAAQGGCVDVAAYLLEKSPNIASDAPLLTKALRYAVSYRKRYMTAFLRGLLASPQC